MPIVVRKLPNQNCYRVFNDKTKVIHSKCSSLGNAKSQQRLLNAVDRGWRPTGGMVGEEMSAIGRQTPSQKWKEAWNEYKKENIDYETSLKAGMNFSGQDIRDFRNRFNSRIDIVLENLKKVEKPTNIEEELINAARGGRAGLVDGLERLVG